MNDDVPNGFLSDPPRRRFPLGTLLAWVVILGVSTVAVVYQRGRSDEREDGRTGEMLLLMQGRYVVGAAQIVPGSRDQMYKSIQNLDRGPLRSRLKFVTLAGELAGTAEALKRLEVVEREASVPEDGEDRKLVDALRRVYTVQGSLQGLQTARPVEPPSLHLWARSIEIVAEKVFLGEADRERVVAELDWFGELALAPAWTADAAARDAVMEPARATAHAMLFGVLAALALVVIGLLTLIVFLVLFFKGTISGGIGDGTPGAAGVYAETFALWMLLFTGLSLAAALVPVERWRMGIGGLAIMASLAVLIWPVFRGVPWRRVRADVGLHTGRGVVREVLCGLATYLMSLPLLAIGLIVMVVFMPDAGRSASHPIAGELANADGWLIAQLFFAACVAAPVVEETLFRGVLYRHLRDTTHGWGFAGSMLVSALVNSFIFAVIHPQGLVGVPVLMGLAMGFTLGREWRGSLIAGMVAHAINNGLVMLFLLKAVSG